MKTNFKSLLPKGFVIFAIVIFLLIFISENINGRFWLNDFKVYYSAAQALTHGTQVYGIHFGLDSGYYKYSPFVLLLFMPFTLLPYNVACIIYYCGIMFFVLGIFVLLKSMIREYFFKDTIKYEGWILTVIFIFILNLLYREFHLGNTNMLLLFLLLLVIKNLVRSRYLISGLLFCLIILFKPFFLILALPMLLHNKWKILGGGIVFMLAQLLILILFLGWNATLLLHSEWLKAILDHSSSFPSNNNIDYLVRSFIYPGLTISFQYFVLAGIVFFFMLLYGLNIFFRRNQQRRMPDADFIFECFVLIAILPSILNTDTEHFLNTLPLITMITYYIFKQKKVFPIICFFILFILYGTNSNDIVGKTIGDFYDKIGVVGISNLLLVIFAFFVYFKRIKKTYFCISEDL